MLPRFVRSTATATSSPHSRSRASARRVISTASACRPSCHRRRPRLRRPLRTSVVSSRSWPIRSAVVSARSAASNRLSSVERSPWRRYTSARRAELPSRARCAISAVDDLLLARAEAERFAHALLLEEQVRDDLAAAIGHAAGPLEHIVECRQRVPELAERDRPLRRPAPVAEPPPATLPRARNDGRVARRVRPSRASPPARVRSRRAASCADERRGFRSRLPGSARA